MTRSREFPMRPLLAAFLALVLFTVGPRVARAEDPSSAETAIAEAMEDQAFSERFGADDDTPAPKSTESGTRTTAKKGDDQADGDDGDADGDVPADDEEDAQEASDEDEPTAGDEEPDAAEEDEDEEDATDDDAGDDDAEAARGAMERAGISTSITKILGKVTDPALRTELEQWNAQREADIRKGFTRAHQQRQAERLEERKELNTLLADKHFREQNPVEWLVQLLLEHPEYADQANAQLEDVVKSPKARKAHDIVIENARKAAAQAITEADQRRDAQKARADVVTKYAQKAAARAGVPFELGVQEAIVAHILTSEDRDISEAEIDRIVAAKAKEYRSHVRAHKREASKAAVKAKVGDRRSAGVKVRPGSGSAPAPAKKRAPQTDDEFVDDIANRLPG